MRTCSSKKLSTQNSLVPLPHTNDPCSDPEWNSCTITSRTTPSSQSCSFTSCHFISCSNNENEPKGNGGAISYDVANGNLTIKYCFFYNCIAYHYEGGGIDARNADDVTISYSTFVSCQAHSSLVLSGGGGVNLWFIKQYPSIKYCSFISCISDDDGSGLNIYNSSSSGNHYACENCVFIKDAVLGNSDSFGGGVLLCDNYEILKCSNLVFTDNEGTFGGAYAICHITQSQIYFLYFCFFHSNIGTYGNDAYLLQLFLENPFLYSFSTAASLRIVHASNRNDWNNPDVFTDYSNWLPQDSINFVNSLGPETK